MLRDKPQPATGKKLGTANEPTENLDRQGNEKRNCVSSQTFYQTGDKEERA